MPKKEDSRGNGHRHNGSVGSKPEADLRLTLEEISDAAYDLAKRAAEAKHKKPELEEKAREMDHLLDELMPRIMAAPEDEQDELQAFWTDARQDVGYVIAGGDLPTSIRLFHFLQDMGLDKDA